MNRVLMIVAACLSLLGGMAQAHGPSRLKTEQSVVLNATVDEVWAALGTFEDMSWLPGVTALEASGNEKGATRTRTMESGVTVSEELLKLDPAKHAISTRLTEDNLEYVLATNYALHITLKDEGGKAKVDFKGAFYRGNPLNDPPADQNDDASKANVEALHQQMIDALVAKFGAAG